ncbi:MAG TPA: hypothetical protein VHW66_08200 [Stellaceae bacterium]|jgi:hypothetical protein|nr:hypothetical protein [Stellaceae bacterium]
MNRRRIEYLLPGALAVAAVILMLLIGGVGGAAQAWLAAYLFWVGLPVGALFASLVHGLTGGGWGIALRPALAAMLRTMPLLALLLIPVLIGAPRIYPWALDGGHGWLALPFFTVRAVVYVVLWNLLALGVGRYRLPDGRLPPGFAWPALILLFGTTTLAAFDWAMTLEPRWTSTIFGLLVTTGWVVSALAVALAATARLTDGERLDAAARLLLAVILLWAYLSAIQLIVIWESDLSREIPWYLRRSVGGWQFAALAFALAEFAVPFVVLVWRPLRRSPMVVAATALMVAAAHLVETWWLTAPDFTRPFGWPEPLAVIAIGGCVLLVARREFARW